MIAVVERIKSLESYYGKGSWLTLLVSQPVMSKVAVVVSVDKYEVVSGRFPLENQKPL